MLKKSGLAAVVVVPLALIALPVCAQDNTKKVNSDISKAIATLDSMQRLGREIDRQHRTEAASARTAGRRASVRTAVQSDSTNTKKANQKQGAKAKKANKKKKSGSP